MKTFKQWLEANNLDLPNYNAEPPTAEQNIRTGIKFGYPDAYAKHYPDSYYAGRTATAYLDLKNRKQQRSKAAPANTPG